MKSAESWRNSTGWSNVLSITEGATVVESERFKQFVQAVQEDALQNGWKKGKEFGRNEGFALGRRVGIEQAANLIETISDIPCHSLAERIRQLLKEKL